MRTRGVTLPAHGTVELIAGMAALAAPVVFGFGAAGIVVSVVIGGLLMGVGMTLQSRLGSAASWHGSLDGALVILTAVGALGLAIAGDRGAATFLALLVAIQALLTVSTRYVTAG